MTRADPEQTRKRKKGKQLVNPVVNSAINLLEPELQVQFLQALGPTDLRSARLACRNLRCLADKHVVTGLQLNVVASERTPGDQQGLYIPELEVIPRRGGDHVENARPSLRNLEAVETSLEEKLEAEEEEEQLDLYTAHRRLILHEQQGTAELHQLVQQLDQHEGFMKHVKRLHEVRMQLVEVRQEQAAIVRKQVEHQLRCMATAEEAAAQLTAAKARFPALRRLTLGAAEHCVLDGAALSVVLAAAPLGSLEHLSLPCCRLNDAAASQLDGLGQACRLDLGLDLCIMYPDGLSDDDDEICELMLQPQLTLLGQGGGWRSNLQSLSLTDGHDRGALVSELGPLSALTALKELTLPDRSIDSDAAQVLQGMTQLVTLRANDWEEGAEPALPASLRHFELVGCALGREGGKHHGERLGPGELNKETHVPCCIQRVLPECAKLKLTLHLTYDERERGSLQALLAVLDAQLRDWAGLQGHLLELGVCLRDHGGQPGAIEAGRETRARVRPLPAIIEALAPVADCVHTLTLECSRHQLDASVSSSLVRTLPPLQKLHISCCHLHQSVVAPLAQLRQLQVLLLSCPYCTDASDWHQVAAGLAAVLADGGGSSRRPAAGGRCWLTGSGWNGRRRRGS